jgi:hypothetical protein
MINRLNKSNSKCKTKAMINKSTINKSYHNKVKSRTTKKTVNNKIRPSKTKMMLVFMVSNLMTVTNRCKIMGTNSMNSNLKNFKRKLVHMEPKISQRKSLISKTNKTKLKIKSKTTSKMTLTIIVRLN